MNIKKTLLVLAIAALGASLSVDASQGPRCKGSQCQRGQQRPEGQQARHGHHERPVWRDVEGQPAVLEVNENNQWVQYQKSAKQCPPMAHHHGHWKGHQHHHEHRQGQGQGQHAHGRGHGHHGPHHSGRHVRYQKNQDGSKVDGVMNVWEQGACWEYTRTSTTRNVTADDQAFIQKMEEQLSVE